MTGLLELPEALPRGASTYISYLEEARYLRSLNLLSLPIGLFYGRFAHRLLTHLILAACLLGGAMMVAALSNGPGFLAANLPVTCTLALHLALAFTVGHLAIDLLTHRLFPGRMAYQRRSVGGQWLVVLGGLALGLCLHRAFLPEVLAMCAPWAGEAGAGLGTPGLERLITRLPLAALGCSAIYANFFMLLMSGNESWLRRAARGMPRPAARADAPPADPPLCYRVDGRKVVIPVERISHVSVEDHYCRIHFQRGGRDQEVLVREALDRLARRLPAEGFIRIHRGHLVNLRHIQGFFRQGRGHGVSLGNGRARLPLSRRRYQELKARRPEIFQA